MISVWVQSNTCFWRTKFFSSYGQAESISNICIKGWNYEGFAKSVLGRKPDETCTRSVCQSAGESCSVLLVPANRLTSFAKVGWIWISHWWKWKCDGYEVFFHDIFQLLCESSYSSALYGTSMNWIRFTVMLSFCSSKVLQPAVKCFF